ncbi:uncharacterized protein LOC143344117 [Colletes latitarsis]|uniref:uncharacterized protein LOC143344117 n=1 Tax=Colletes latitarsis TaxID=2605962 RepID=UPI00403711F6
MSTQKGNSNRSRPQKYKNRTAFKNDLHDTSHKIKIINSIEVANVCERCKQVIEWKIKYKKYKPLKAPSKCTKCQQKSVKHAYHNVCLPCAKQFKVCPKCGVECDIVEGTLSKEESMKLDKELQVLLKELPERKRRTFIRYMNHNASNKTKNKNSKGNGNEETEIEEQEKNETMVEDSVSKNELLSKLRSLLIKEKDDENFDIDDDLDSDSDSDTDTFT